MSSEFDAEFNKPLRLLVNGSMTTRFHTVGCLKPDTVGDHSGMVASILVLLYPMECTVQLLKAALFHDSPEFLTGDVPAPTKNWRPEVRESLNEIEDRVFTAVDGRAVQLSEANSRRLKVADRLSGLMYCVKEITMGNSRMMFPAVNFACYLASMELSIRELEFCIAAVRAYVPPNEMELRGFPYGHALQEIVQHLSLSPQLAASKASSRWEIFSFEALSIR